MKRWGALALLALAAACMPAETPASIEQQWQLCQNSVIPAQRLGACSFIVASDASAPERRAQALFQRGLERAQRGQHVRAIADFGRALRMNPDFVEAYVERGLAHQARGAYQSAILDFDAALARDPNSYASSLRASAMSLLNTAQANELEQLMEAIALDPGNADLWNNRCWLRAVEGEQLEYALGDCNEALRLAPGEAAFHDSRGLVHLKLGNYVEALADYEAAVNARPDEPHFRFGRGVALLRLGMRLDGEADIAAAEQAQPGIAAQYAAYGVTP
ncbi:MAG: tetratricopeptide repeat protein [Hyphomonadaceae bacterium]|nr:tetratricopeptide repeat protein [Hyphomonadaceae bacterium]